jgi:Fe-S-cluster containining protein
MAKPALQFRVLDEPVSVELEPIPQRMRLDEILPVLQTVDDQLTAIAVRKNGQPVSCTKGCSACCRIQPVPVTPAEAFGLLRLVEELPEPRRTQVLSRFDDCAARLRQAGVADAYLEGRRAETPELAQSYARGYLDLRLACPFLEDDACSIYPQRPLVCREYLVTSPKELCIDPLTLPVKPVPLLVSLVRANLQVSAQLTGTLTFTVPLTLALVYASIHRQELERSYPGAEVFTRSIQMLGARY